MTERRTTKNVEALLDKLVDVFDDVLTNGETETTREGEVVRVTPKPATLNVIRQFIESQGVKVLVEKNPKVQAVAAKVLALPIQPNEINPKERAG
jgi:hypothetical protein